MPFQNIVRQALVASTMLVLPAAAYAQAPTTQDLVGTWNISLTSPQGTYPTSVSIKEENGVLGGSVTGLPGTTPLTVKTSEAGVTMEFSVDYQGQPIPIVMKGKLDGNAIKGTVDFAGGAAAGEFEGTKAGAVATNGGATNGAAGSLTGTWAIVGEGGGGWSMELTQDGTAVTGTLKNPDQGLALPMKGTFENGALSLTITNNGDSIGVTRGTLENGALKGTYDLAGSSGSWTGTRKQ